jgi:5-methylcytosine-specific restriction endonuclease McrA
MDSLEDIKQKYNDIIPRSFNTKLEVFLFKRCITKGNLEEISVDEFKHFQINPEIVDIYQNAWQLEADDSLDEGGLKMREIDNMIEQWNKQNEDLKKDLLENYRILFVTDYFPFSEFEEIYDQDPQKRTCHYCNKSDQYLSGLRNDGKIYTKRVRGYAMEIDRIKGNYEYKPDNVVLACYWCNNAKTDEFSEEEFTDNIGPGIERVWNDRAEDSSTKSS